MVQSHTFQLFSGLGLLCLDFGYRNITVWSLLKHLSVVYAQHHSVIYAETSQCGSCSKIPLDGLWMTEFHPNANVLFIYFILSISNTLYQHFLTVSHDHKAALRQNSPAIQYISCSGCLFQEGGH
jgi:hypothetical protein